jgi:hypothetical protein
MVYILRVNLDIFMRFIKLIDFDYKNTRSLFNLPINQQFIEYQKQFNRFLEECLLIRLLILG